MVMVQYIFKQAFQLNKGGLAAAASVVLFLLIVVMSVLQFQLLRARGGDERDRVRRGRRRRRSARGGLRGCAMSTLIGLVVTLATLVAAIFWAFPLYWGLVTTFKPEYEIVRPGVQLWPQHFTFENYVHVLLDDQDRLLVRQLARSPPAAVTVIVIVMAAGAGYAISQLEFPGRTLLLVDDPGELHGADPGADRQSFRPDEPVPAGSTRWPASSRRS